MTQGFMIGLSRPKSKKALKEAIETHPERVIVEATSFHGNEYEGFLNNAPNGTIVFCGPDPHTDRRFYGTVIVKDGTYKVK